jgi:predicted transcriptional regulator
MLHRKRDPQTVLFDPSQTGLDRMLAPLESRIMQIVWSEPYYYIVEDVVRLLMDNGLKRDRNTIASVLIRLRNKEIVTRTRETVTREGRELTVNVYYSTKTRYQFERDAIFAILDNIKDENESILREWLVLHTKDFV